MNITRAGTKPSARGPGYWFTGTVRTDGLFDASSPARAAGAAVTFEPGARTAWHTHPLGQTLLGLFGRGLVQRDGKAVRWMEHVSDEQYRQYRGEIASR